MPKSLQEKWSELNKLGIAEYSKFGFDLYDAELWASSDKVDALNKQNVYGLSLKYKRNIKQEQLLKATAKQWRRLQLDATLSKSWLAQLESIWPDIKKGHTLSFVIDTQNNSLFYLGDRYLGEINDHRFGFAFLDIWLHEQSQFKKQRQQLLGS